LGDVFNPQLIAARILANLTAPLLDGGVRQTRVDIARVQAELALAGYASGLLEAWSEVEGALAADVLLQAQEAALQTALDEAIEAEKLAERQFSGGLATIFELLDAQARRFSTESSLITVQAERASNRILYHLALGGDVPAAALDGLAATPSGTPS
jgi:outer membrane protein TolC